MIRLLFCGGSVTKVDFADFLERAAAGHRDRIRLVQRVADQPRNPAVVVRIKPVIQRQRNGQRPRGIIALDAARDDRLLVPQQPSLDIHVLEREGVLGADQGRQFADLQRKLVGQDHLAVGHRNRPERIPGNLVHMEVLGPEGRKRIAARHREELERSLVVLQPDQGARRIDGRAVIAGHRIALEHPHTGERAAEIELPERVAGIEADRVRVRDSAVRSAPGSVSVAAGASAALGSFVPGGGATRFGSGVSTCAKRIGAAPSCHAAASSEAAPTVSRVLDLCVMLSPRLRSRLSVPPRKRRTLSFCMSATVEKKDEFASAPEFGPLCVKAVATRPKNGQISSRQAGPGQVPARPRLSRLLDNLAVDREIEPLALGVGIDAQPDHDIDQLQQDQADDRAVQHDDDDAVEPG